jgi:molybdopterin-binding protein
MLFYTKIVGVMQDHTVQADDFSRFHTYRSAHVCGASHAAIAPLPLCAAHPLALAPAPAPDDPMPHGPRFANPWLAAHEEDPMALSARNHLSGTIDDIIWGDVMVHVTVRVGDALVESVITRRSADEMGLKKGDTVTAVVKATEVMLSK